MQKKEYKKLTLYGPVPLSDTKDGELGDSMADIFPSYGAMIVGRGLHVNLALEFMEELAHDSGGQLNEDEQEKVLNDLVAVMQRGDCILIRSIPDDMKRVFRAAELLEEVVPTDRVRFTGSRDAQVRDAFKKRGESWKMTPRYFTIEEIIRQVELSRVKVDTENVYYYNIESGGRLLTFQEFEKIGRCMDDLENFRQRICEVTELHRRRNNRFVRELDFFMVDDSNFDFSLIVGICDYVKELKTYGIQQREQVKKLYGNALDNFRESVPLDYHRDDPSAPLWRTHMYSQLNDIPPTEESILGVSEEFNMNINWVPGCRIENSKVYRDPNIGDQVSDLLDEFFHHYGPLEYINIGQVMRSQSNNRAAGSYREVYIAVLRQIGNAQEQIRMLRKVQRNTLFYLNRGFDLEKSEKLAVGYMQYTMDRRDILSILGFNTPVVNQLSRHEELPGVGTITMNFFDRPYVDGLATDKISYYYYQSEPFVLSLLKLMGDSAALNLMVGRCDPDTGSVFFGDGDEMLQFNGDPMQPLGVMLADFTGTFADVMSPLRNFAPFYEEFLIGMLRKVQIEGMNRLKILELSDIFVGAMYDRFALTVAKLSEPRVFARL